MTKENLKTFAAVMAALALLGLFIAGLREFFGNAILWMVLAGLLWLAATLLAEQVRRRRIFRKQGYLVTEDSQRHFVYRERLNGGIRELRLPSEWIENGHPVYYRMAQEIWAETVPEWARERRLEIEGRILENRFYRPEEF